MKLVDLVATVGILLYVQAHNACAASESFSRFDVTESYSIQYSNDLPPKTVGTIKSVMHVLFAETPTTGLLKLKSFAEDTRGSYRNRYATYDETQSRVFINTSSLQNEQDEWETIAHEVGHALIFSRLTPGALSKIAHDVGGWSISSIPNTFYDSSFFVRFFGADLRGSSFPTLYSYTNIHEWFAENFAVDLLSKANGKKPVNLALRNFFDELLK